jgi:6-phosphofructokinase 1
MRRIAVLTSGGDAAGMNAAIRAVVRSAASRDIEVLGVKGGYTGLIAGDILRLGVRDVGGIIGRGGTILGTTRCEQIKSEAGQIAALRQLRARDISSLVVIGGNGSQTAAYALSGRGLPVVGIASTIDNDLVGSDPAIGATTAVDVALEAIDRLRITAASHNRVFLVEVMGRDSGHLAMAAAIAGGAESVVIPEKDTHPEVVAEEIRAAYRRGKSHAIVVVAEGSKCAADGLAAYFKEHSQRLGFELRVTKLGHIQRGGAPGVFDRMLATELGVAAIAHLSAGITGVLVGRMTGKVTSTPLSEVAHKRKPLEPHWLDLAAMLTR